MSEILKLPAVEPRLETGPVQFGDDWPGIFLRGDYAGPMAMYLTTVLDCMERGEKPSWTDVMVLRGFAAELSSSRVMPRDKS